MEKILIVDDEKDIVSFLRTYFQMEGYQVMSAHSGSEAITQIEHQPDLILLDINMPELNGIDTCKLIRNKVNCPIIFLTARVQDLEIIEGLSVGADDYVTKPFNIDVLGARVISHLRRDNRENKPNSLQRFGHIAIDYESYQVFVYEKEINLTPIEFNIVSLLSKYKGQVFDKERIYELVWGYDAKGDSTSVTEYIKRIRNKFNKVSCSLPIQTVWGVGYRWEK